MCSREDTWDEVTMSVVQRIFGTHSEREIKRISGLVDKICLLYTSDAADD